nr:hypothetical protein [Wolbachia endosymbiont (group A) of Anomoia purmunda]
MQIRAAKPAKPTVLGVIEFISNIITGTNTDAPRNKKLAMTQVM